MTDIKKPYNKWQETTLRKGVKSPKISRDMFIAESRGEFTFCEVKNGKLFKKERIEKVDALECISIEKLIAVPDMVFNDCNTYRTETSNRLIEIVLDSIEKVQ